MKHRLDVWLRLKFVALDIRSTSALDVEQAAASLLSYILLLSTSFMFYLEYSGLVGSTVFWHSFIVLVRHTAALSCL